MAAVRTRLESRALDQTRRSNRQRGEKSNFKSRREAGDLGPRYSAPHRRHPYVIELFRAAAADNQRVAPHAERGFLVSHQTILVLDFGSQYTQLIARRLRELSVYSEIVPFNTPLERAAREATRSGSSCPAGRAACPTRARRKCDPAVFELGMPVLGICYGMQLMTDMLGGEVRRSGHREFGHAPGPRAGGRASRRSAARGHGCSRTSRRAAGLGEPRRRRGGGAARVCRRGHERHGADRRDGSAGPRQLYALLFHPEVVHTDHGLEILRNFAYSVCGCTGDWTIASFIEEATERIRHAGRRRARSSAACRAASIRPSRRC